MWYVNYVTTKLLKEEEEEEEDEARGREDQALEQDGLGANAGPGTPWLHSLELAA